MLFRSVALLYKARWDVEKVFDEFKNKLGECKRKKETLTKRDEDSRNKGSHGVSILKKIHPSPHPAHREVYPLV